MPNNFQGFGVQTVSQLTAAIKFMLETGYRFIAVCGEVSNLRMPFSGHQYFTLKDETAQIRAVLLKPQVKYLLKPLQDGQKIICRGRISVYEQRGEYQIVIDTIEHFGAGALHQQFLQLKSKLAAEGLFDQAHKKAIPRFPEKIVIITSATGAAVHDFLKIWRQRQSAIHIQIWPVAVQGRSAAAEIREAIIEINASLACDCIVLCRGGGSLEDLWPFNDEMLAQAIFKSNIPIVAGIGHETDFTIADFVADFRAATPTGAAEALIPDAPSLASLICELQTRMQRTMNAALEAKTQKLRQHSASLSRFTNTYDSLFLKVDALSEKLVANLNLFLASHQHRLSSRQQRLEQYSPQMQVFLKLQRLSHLEEKLLASVSARLLQHNTELERQAGLLHSCSPLAVLSRGYALVRKAGPAANREVVVNSAQVQVGEVLEILLKKGELIVKVVEDSTK